MKQNKILLIISKLNPVAIREVLNILTLEFFPVKIVLMISEDKDNEAFRVDSSAEYRAMSDEGRENSVLKTVRELTLDKDDELICCVDGDAELNRIAVQSMILSGRYQDRLCHFGVSPFELSDIPYPRLNYLLRDYSDSLPDTFSDTLELANLRISQTIEAPELLLSTDPPRCMIGNCELQLSRNEFILFWLLAARCKNQVIPMRSSAELLSEYKAFIESTLSSVMPEICEIRVSLINLTASDMRGMVDSLDTKVREQISFENGRDYSLPVRDGGIFGITFPPANVVCPRNY